MFSITCAKDQHTNLWCFDYQFEKNSFVKDEPLMHQATDLIDLILNEAHGSIANQISICFDAFKLHAPDVILKYKEPSGSGSMYQAVHVLNKVKDYQHDVWLCSVLTQFFPMPPSELYVLIKPVVK
jgi:hypothetical protein